MRKIFTIVFILISLSVCTYAQTGQDILKKARRDAKELVKAGWKPYIKMPDIEEQLNNAYLLEDRVIDGESQYFMGSSRCRGNDLQKAHSAAMMSARTKIAKDINSYISTNIIVKMGSDSNQRISRNILVTTERKLGKTEPIVDIYREMNDDKYEVEVRISYAKKEIDKNIDEVIKTVSE